MTNVRGILCNCVPYPIHGVNGTTVYVSLCMVQGPLSANQWCSQGGTRSNCPPFPGECGVEEALYGKKYVMLLSGVDNNMDANEHGQGQQLNLKLLWRQPLQHMHNSMVYVEARAIQHGT